MSGTPFPKKVMGDIGNRNAHWEFKMIISDGVHDGGGNLEISEAWNSISGRYRNRNVLGA